ILHLSLHFFLLFFLFLLFFSIFFFFNDTATTEIYTLSLHDALPILFSVIVPVLSVQMIDAQPKVSTAFNLRTTARQLNAVETLRSEEHTSELQSRFDLVCRLLLEKKKNI